MDTKRMSVRYISGQEVFDAPITITTWQSFAKAPKEVLQVI